MKKAVLIDGNSLMHRAYHGVKFAPVVDGQPVGMLYGFASMIINIIAEYDPDFLVVAFDTKEKTFRHKMDQEYKAHRAKADDEFYAQIPLVYECLECFDIQILRAPGYEADDVIGTVAKKTQKDGIQVDIVSSDLDFLQLVSDDGICLVRPNGNIQNSEICTPEEAEKKIGVRPDQVVDYKAIVGDSSDNYKGIPGVGPKTTVNLLKEYGTLKKIYNHLNELSPTVKKKFEDHKEYAFHCQELAQIKTDVPLEYSLEVFSAQKESIINFLNKFKFSSLVRRYKNKDNLIDQPLSVEQNKYPKNIDNDGQMSLF